MTHRIRFGAAALLFAVACAAQAQPMTPQGLLNLALQGIVNLSASATAEVPRDLLSVTLSVSRDGPDAAAVQGALKQALDAALADARKVAKPGQVDVQAGNFALFPRYSKQNVISGWQGNAEMTVEGRDMQAIAALTGRITTLSIARVAYSLSREAREKVEGDLAAQAITRYRAQAADYAKQFGYAGFNIREVSVGTEESHVPQPMPRMKAMAAMSSDEALPVEAGRGTVVVRVNGSVQMVK